MTGLAGEERSNLKIFEFENLKMGMQAGFLFSSPSLNVVNLHPAGKYGMFIFKFSNYHIFKLTRG